MKRWLLLTSCFSIILNSCDAPPQDQDEQPGEIILYSYELKTLEKRTPACTDRCTEVILTFPVFNAGLELHDTYNEIIRARLKAEVSNYLMDELSSRATLHELAQEFISGYEEYKSQFPESQVPWELKIDVMVSHTHPSFISLVFNTISYTGGAHPNKMVVYLNLNDEGTLLEFDDFVADRAKLVAIAESRFRSQHQLSSTDDLAEAGFMFDDDQFQLTDNFGFTRTGMVFYYNSYEIAPYSEGPTALFIPFEVLDGVLK